MKKINKLPPHEAQKIAAGEVVERPANVLKELLENAIDAQATKISIYIKDGGKSYMRVVDNGCGMSADDATFCFEQYATSKITHVDQLSTINTFGFRGEALASIASVSKTTLITREASTDQGTKIEITANNITATDIVHANVGTDITVADLFYNLPARKKFLKTKETEWHQIQQLFFAFCLAHTQIDFKLYSEDKLLYTCPKVEQLKDRVEQLFESKQAINMLTVNSTHNNVQLHGLVSNHQYERYDRNMIYLFVNQRWVKDSNLTHAFIKGYKQVLQPGRYPTGCIHMNVDPQEVDINIHPRKEEVQFLHPRVVQQALTSSITQALEHNLAQQLKKPVHIRPSNTFEHRASYIPSEQPTYNAFDFDSFFKQAAHKEPLAFTPTVQEAPAASQNVAQTEMLDDTDPIIIGQYHKTYLMLEQSNGLLLIDQHAAHERILYEQFCAQHGHMPTIKAMFPSIMHLTDHDYRTVIAHFELFALYGIELEPFGTNTLKVTATPLQLKNVSIETIIKDAIVSINEHETLDATSFNQIMQKTLYANMACKAAVKAGDQLTHELMLELIRNLYKTKNRLSCPHGRPTHYLLHIDEIEKKFKRDYRKQQEI